MSFPLEKAVEYLRQHQGAYCEKALRERLATEGASPEVIDQAFTAVCGTQAQPSTAYKSVGEMSEAMSGPRAGMDRLHFQEAAKLLENVLIDSRELSGPEADRLITVVTGWIGECHFQSGDAKAALPLYERCLARCRRSGEAEGITAYLRNVLEANRYLGNRSAAGDASKQLSAHMEATGDAAGAEEYKRWARILKAGEPLLRVVVRSENKVWEVGDIPSFKSASISLGFARNRPTLAPALALARQAEELARQGKFEEALPPLRDAAAADVYDPACRYQAGEVLMHLQRFSEAVDYHSETERLAPGWRSCREDLWLAQKISAGKLIPQVFSALRGLEVGGIPEDKIMPVAQGLCAEYPDLAPAHRLRGSVLLHKGKTEEAAAAYRQALKTVEEPSLETKILFDLSQVVGDKEERTKLLKKAVDLNGDLLAAAFAAISLKSALEA